MLTRMLSTKTSITVLSLGSLRPRAVPFEQPALAQGDANGIVHPLRRAVKRPVLATGAQTGRDGQSRSIGWGEIRIVDALARRRRSHGLGHGNDWRRDHWL